jgi:ribonuclease P protein component
MASLEKRKGCVENKFPKKERLSSKKLIEELFDKGSSSYLHPFRLFFKPGPLLANQKFPQLLVSVPKRNFKKAVDRNRLRRQIKEAYRINKNNIFSDIGENIPPHIAILFTAKEKLPFKLLEEKLILILKRLKNIQ